MATKKEATPKKTAGRKVATPRTATKKSTTGKEPVQEQISRVAYELFVKSGYVHGKDVEHWLEAERIVLGRKKSK